MKFSVDEKPSKYTGLGFRLDQIDDIFIINFEPRGKDNYTSGLGAYPVDLSFDVDRELCSITVLWPPEVWKMKSDLDFPKSNNYIRLIYNPNKLPIDDDEYSAEVYTNPSFNVLCIEFTADYEEPSQFLDELAIYYLNRDCAVEISGSRLSKLWVKNHNTTAFML